MLRGEQRKNLVSGIEETEQNNLISIHIFENTELEKVVSDRCM